MHIEVQVPVGASIESVWQKVTDIDNAAETISGIDEVQILEKPSEGLVGLKWKETRTMMGKQADETIWVTEAVENDYYLTEARSHGSIYKGKIRVAEEGGITNLSMTFDAEPQTFGAKILSATMGFMFRGATEKALRQDLMDVKKAVEASEGVNG